MSVNLEHHSVAENREQLGGILCMACGFCCRGLIFPAVLLQPDELEKATLMQLPVYGKEEKGYNQPCPCYDKGKCSIYEDRFHSCRSYKCQLLKRLLEGSLELEEALGVVQTALDTEEALYKELDRSREPSKSIWTVIDEFLTSSGANDSPEQRKNHAGLLLKARMLSLMCHRYFEPSMHAAMNANDQPIRAGQLPMGKTAEPSCD